MGKFFLLCISFLFSISCWTQEIVKSNFHIADSIFNEAVRQNDFLLNYKALYTGKIYLRGHWAKPNMVDSIIFDNIQTHKDGRYLSESLVFDNNDTIKAMLAYNEVSDSCFQRTIYSKEFTYKGHDNVFDYYLSPFNILKDVFENKATLHYLTNDNSNYILGYNDTSGNKYYVSFDKNNLLISHFSKVYADHTDGDTYDRIDFSDYIQVDGSFFPKNVQYLKNDNIKQLLTLTGAKEITPDTLYMRIKRVNMQMTEISDGVYFVDFVDANNRTIVLKNKDHLSVFEAPINAVYSTDLIHFLNEKFPNTPIKYCYLTHHHPDHAGGLKAFKNIGCTIIAPKQEISYLKSVIDQPYSMSSIYNNPLEAIFVGIDQGMDTIFVDGMFNVHAYEIGKTTDHAANFIAYYVPESNMLISSDLFYTPSVINNAVYKQGERAYSIYNLIQQHNDIKKEGLRIVPTFPTQNFKPYASYSELEQKQRGNK